MKTFMIVDSFFLHKELGNGSQAKVYLAEDLKFKGKLYALKLFRA